MPTATTQKKHLIAKYRKKIAAIRRKYLAAQGEQKAKPSKPLTEEKLVTLLQNAEGNALSYADLRKRGYSDDALLELVEASPRIFKHSYLRNMLHPEGMKGQVTLRPKSQSKGVPYKGQGVAGTDFFIDKIAEKVQMKSLYPQSINITITNPDGAHDTSVRVDVSAKGGEIYTQFRPFQFIAKDYADAFEKLNRCIGDYIEQTGYDPLQ